MATMRIHPDPFYRFPVEEFDASLAERDRLAAKDDRVKHLAATQQLPMGRQAVPATPDFGTPQEGFQPPRGEFPLSSRAMRRRRR